MYIMDLMHLLFPIIGFILLIIGLTTFHKNYIIIALWLSLIALILHYQTSGGEILGTYFNYKHTLLYSLNLLILLISIIYLTISFSREKQTRGIKYAMSFLGAISLIGVLILLGNLWVNAWFVEDRQPNTPILQVVTFKKVDYCNYSYIFYKLNKLGKVTYMCPNHFGLLPSVGYLEVAPEFILKQLPPPLQEKFSSSKSNI